MDYHIIKEKTCCFFGHRKITETDELKAKLYKAIKRLIIEDNVDTFLFGSRSQFDSLAHLTVTELKNEYNHIKRIYVRAEYPYIDEYYEKYLLQKYEYTYYPETILKAGKSVYIKRNYEMINNSDFCVVYYISGYGNQNSGTEIAYNYAKRKNINIQNIV